MSSLYNDALKLFFGSLLGVKWFQFQQWHLM